jgi:hypothetical protein
MINASNMEKFSGQEQASPLAQAGRDHQGDDLRCLPGGDTLGRIEHARLAVQESKPKDSRH